VSGARKLPPREIARRRRRPSRRQRPRCNDHVVLAPLWVAYSANVGTLARTCDAVGACLALARGTEARAALRRGNTLPQTICVHWVAEREHWLRRQKERGAHVLAVEVAEGATRLAALPPADRRTVVLLGHERHGVPEELWPLIDEVVEIPMLGTGASLNVAVAGSLVAYRLSGML
jgi:tRNA (guanosine-2'-O-)-methyltransferase